MQVIVVIKNLFLGTSHSLTGTLLRGGVKNNMLSLSLSRAEVEYCAMMHASFEMLWVRSFLEELSFPVHAAMPMYCENQAAISFQQSYFS